METLGDRARPSTARDSIDITIGSRGGGVTAMIEPLERE